MPKKVDRDNPSGPLSDFDPGSLDQVKSGKVVIELADGSDHVIGTVEQVISGLVKNEVADLIRKRIIDLEYVGNEAWVTAIGNNNLSVLRGSVDAATINAISDWAASYDIPSGTEIDGAIVVRLAKGENPNDYRLFNGIGLLNIGDFLKISFITSQTYDYYVTTLAFTGRYAVGETLVLQHHGEEGHSLFHGSAPAIESRIDDVADDVAGKQNIRAVDIDFDHHYWLRGENKETVYFLEVTNMVPELLPDVDGISVLVSGILVDDFAISLDNGDMVFPIEVSVAEATSINAILGPGQADLLVSARFRNGATVVHTVELPFAVVDVDPLGIGALADDVAGKEDARPFDAFIDRNYYVRTNRDAITYHLQLHNIVSALLPDVDTLAVLMRGSPVHSASFDPTASTDQVIPIELSDSEALNIANNVRDDTTILIELSFRDGSTEVLREIIQIPVVAAPPRREKREILGFDLSRANDVDATLPTDYEEWDTCYIISGDATREDTHLILTSDLAMGNLINIGRGDANFDWNSSTRVLSGKAGPSRFITVALL